MTEPATTNRSRSLFRYSLCVERSGPLSDGAIDRVSARFRALGEPMRLKILQRLFRAPASVGEILADVGGTQANVSKHLALLHSAGLVSRRKQGTRAVYAITDPTLERICEIVCDAVSRDARAQVRELSRPARRSRRA